MTPAIATLRFTVPGRPIPKARPRLGRGGRVFTPERTKAYEALVGHYAAASLSFLEERELQWCKTAEYRVTIACYFKPGPAPDCDNLAKSALDGANGIVWDDDRQVTYLTVMRLVDRNERAEITVEQISEPKPRKASKPRKAKVEVVNYQGADALMGIFGLKRAAKPRKRVKRKRTVRRRK